MIWKLVKLICAANLYLCGGNIGTRTFFVFQHIAKNYMKVSKVNLFQKTYAMEKSRFFWKFWLNVNFPNNLVLVLLCFEPVPSEESFSKTFDQFYMQIYICFWTILILECLMSTEKSYILKQTGSCRLV